jgi:hypothetical protein
VAAEATAEPTEARAIFRRLVAFKGLQGGFLPPRRAARASLASRRRRINTKARN